MTCLVCREINERMRRAIRDHSFRMQQLATSQMVRHKFWVKTLSKHGWDKQTLELMSQAK